MFRWPQKPSRAGIGFFNVPDAHLSLRLVTTALLRRVEEATASPYLDKGLDEWQGPLVASSETLARIVTTPAAPMPGWVKDDLQVFESTANTVARVRPATETLQRLKEGAQLRELRTPAGDTWVLPPAHAELLARGTAHYESLKEHERERFGVLQGRFLLHDWKRTTAGMANAAAAATSALDDMTTTLGLFASAGIPLRPPSGKFAQVAAGGPGGGKTASRATMMTMEAPPGYELITGKTFPVKDAIKALGGRWAPEQKGWFVPTHHADEARRLVRNGVGNASTTQTYPCWECGVVYTPEEYAARQGNLTEWWCGCGVIAAPRKHRPNFGR